MNLFGSGTCNRLSPLTHDEERDEERGQGLALSLLKLEIPNDFGATDKPRGEGVRTLTQNCC